MVKVDRQSSFRLGRFVRGNPFNIWAILGISSCFFGVWGYLIGSSSINSNNDSFVTNSVASLRGGGDGWSTIQVFYGDQSLLKQSKDGWYSQVKQDQVVSALFRNKQKGFFIDLASNDAVSLSNTFALEERFNWNGLCIEPNPTYWLDLSARRCELIGAVVGKNRMEKVSFTLAKKEFGGIIGDKFDHVNKKKGMRPRDFFTVPLLEIFETNKVPRYIDYLSLDIEGAELFVMESFPFERYVMRVITIERPKKTLRDILERNGYKLLCFLSDFGETLWIHESARAMLDVAALDAFELPDQKISLKNLQEMNYEYLKRWGLNQTP